MDEAKYVCEPHYDENGKFDYWNPLFPYKRDTCEGCVYEYATCCDDEPCCNCERLYLDLYTAKVVE